MINWPLVKGETPVLTLRQLRWAVKKNLISKLWVLCTALHPRSAKLGFLHQHPPVITAIVIARPYYHVNVLCWGLCFVALTMVIAVG